MRSITIEMKNGSSHDISVTEDTAIMLASDDTDPSIKTLIVKNLIANLEAATPPSAALGSPQQALSHESMMASCSSEQHTSIEKSGQRSVSPALSSDSSCSSSSLHIWKRNEEDLLVSLRHEKSDKFVKTRNHTELWKEICTEMNFALEGCNVSQTQAMNKYHSLKKRWKEIIDAGTGTEAKYFRQREAFDEMWGTRASTKPKFQIDTLKETQQEQSGVDAQQEQSGVDENKVKGKGKQSTKVKTSKRKSQQLIDVLELHHGEFQEKMTTFHGDQMNRMDRLLDLYEKAIKLKKSKYSSASASDEM